MNFVSLLMLIFVLRSVTGWDCINKDSPNFQPSQIYSSQGTIRKLPIGIDIYEIGNGKNLLIGISDIYGIDSINTKQTADFIADNNDYIVILPDFFQGHPWTFEKGYYPNPLTSSEYVQFLEDHSWENSVRQNLTQILKYYKSLDYSKIGIFGVKFGANKVASASSEMQNDLAFGIQLFPAPNSVELAQEVKIPSLVLLDKWPSGLEFIPTWPNASEYCSVVNSGIGSNSCFGADFPYELALGSEADWTNITVRNSAASQLKMVQDFLCLRY